MIYPKNAVSFLEFDKNEVKYFNGFNTMLIVKCEHAF